MFRRCAKQNKRVSKIVFKRKLMSLFYVALACVFWGLIPTITKLLQQGPCADPKSLAYLRFLIGFIFCFSYCTLSEVV